jgi:hypothetical protein
VLQRIRRLRIKSALSVFLLAALLLSLGLRVCLHTLHAADEAHTHAVAIHLESNLTSPADSGDEANDSHVPLPFALFKFGKLLDNLAAAAVLVALLLLLPRQTTRVPAPAGAIPALSGGHRFRPPLRAPPR